MLFSVAAFAGSANATAASAKAVKFLREFLIERFLGFGFPIRTGNQREVGIDRRKNGAEKNPCLPVRATDSASSVQDGGHIATLLKNRASAHRPNPQTHTVNARCNAKRGSCAVRKLCGERLEKTKKHEHCRTVILFQIDSRRFDMGSITVQARRNCASISVR